MKIHTEFNVSIKEALNPFRHPIELKIFLDDVYLYNAVVRKNKTFDIYEDSDLLLYSKNTTYKPVSLFGKDIINVYDFDHSTFLTINEPKNIYSSFEFQNEEYFVPNAFVNSIDKLGIEFKRFNLMCGANLSAVVHEYAYIDVCLALMCYITARNYYWNG